MLFKPLLESRPFKATQQSDISKEIGSGFSKTAIINIHPTSNPLENILEDDIPYTEKRDRLLLIRKLVQIPEHYFPVTLTNASVGTVHGIACEHLLQVIQTKVKARGTILDIPHREQGTSISIFFEGPNMSHHEALGPRWYSVSQLKNENPRFKRITTTTSRAP